MLDVLIELLIAVGACVIWFAGLRLFLQSDLSRDWQLNVAQHRLAAGGDACKHLALADVRLAGVDMAGRPKI